MKMRFRVFAFWIGLTLLFSFAAAEDDGSLVRITTGGDR